MKVIAIAKVLLRRIFSSRLVEDYINANSLQFRRPGKRKNRQVLINCVQSFPLIELYANASNFLAERHGASIKHYYFEVDTYDRIGVPNPVLHRIYASFGSNLGFGWGWWRLDAPMLVLKAVYTFIQLQCKNDILDLKIDEIPVGTLVYDTYLRRYKKETISMRSWALLWVLIEAHFIARRTTDYFNRFDVVTLIPGDVAYIYSGIVARAAILRGIPTYSVVEIPRRLQVMDSSFYRRAPFWRYRDQFAILTIEEKSQAKRLGAELIAARLSGEVDRNMSYMRQSAYTTPNASKKFLKNTSSKKALILLHDFFDSPHVYRNMLFADFWEWITFTLKCASFTNYEWYVKPHPNALPGNQNLVNQLKQMFPSVHFLDPTASNRQLVDEGINVVFSVYGSCGHEFPYFGVPVVMAGDNPHVAYDFNWHPKTVEEYQRLIEEAVHLPCHENYEELCEFYFMHYLYYKTELPIDPVYPPEDYCERMGLQGHSSKEQRTIYHRSELTLSYILEKRGSEQQDQIYSYFERVF